MPDNDAINTCLITMQSTHAWLCVIIHKKLGIC